MEQHIEESGPWTPGISSEMPAEMRPLVTLLRPENSRTPIATAQELQKLTALPLGELVALRPERLLLHELLVRVTADFSVPDGSRIEDLGINFREIVRLLLARYIAPKMSELVSAFERTRNELEQLIHIAWCDVTSDSTPGRTTASPTQTTGPAQTTSPAQAAGPSRLPPLGIPSLAARLSRLFQRRTHRHPPPGTGARQPSTTGSWGLEEISTCERRAAIYAAGHPSATAGTQSYLTPQASQLAQSEPPLQISQPASAQVAQLQAVAYRSLARVMSALFAVHGQPWGTRELIVSLATDLACNTYGSETLGQLIEPLLQQAARSQGYGLLPSQSQPVVINTKGPSASGKSTLRPLQRRLAGAVGVQWSDFALISPDIWRKQLLDYASLGSAYKYAGALTSDELQIVDQKLDRYMALKQRRGAMSHLLIDRFRFDSFAADSDQAGSNLLTRFGHSVYLFFMITPPEQLVERAWKRGLEVGRYKAVDDTLAHSVEAYAGMPNVFFTWIHRSDKRIHFEFLDNSVRFGDLPRTVAFGSNDTIHVLDVSRLLDIERFGRVNVEARTPESLYGDPTLLEPRHNLGFLKQCIAGFREVIFAQQTRGQIYLRMVHGRPVIVDRELLGRMLQSPDVRVSFEAIAPGALSGSVEIYETPHYLRELRSPTDSPTIGEWGDEPVPGRP